MEMATTDVVTTELRTLTVTVADMVLAEMLHGFKTRQRETAGPDTLRQQRT
jgi:hypothetical protein